MNSGICPWDTSVLAGSNFCEEILCSWIAQPANTWTNIGFLWVGFILLKLGQRENFFHIRALGFVSFVIGFGSAFYHMTGTYLGVVFDYAGMLLMASYSISVNLRRWLLWDLRKLYLSFLIIFSSWIGLLLYLPGEERFVYGYGSMICCFIEARLYFRDGKAIRYRNFLLAWLAFSIGLLAWRLDLKHVFCEPTNHAFSLHGVWHLMMAASIYYTGIYYSQFESLKR
jgi:hypothetical protein